MIQIANETAGSTMSSHVQINRAATNYRFHIFVAVDATDKTAGMGIGVKGAHFTAGNGAVFNESIADFTGKNPGTGSTLYIRVYKMKIVNIADMISTPGAAAHRNRGEQAGAAIEVAALGVIDLQIDKRIVLTIKIPLFSLYLTEYTISDSGFMLSKVKTKALTILPFCSSKV